LNNHSKTAPIVNFGNGFSAIFCFILAKINPERGGNYGAVFPITARVRGFFTQFVFPFDLAGL
jgi:hypothetical protein